MELRGLSQVNSLEGKRFSREDAGSRWASNSAEISRRRWISELISFDPPRQYSKSSSPPLPLCPQRLQRRAGSCLDSVLQKSVVWFKGVRREREFTVINLIICSCAAVCWQRLFWNWHNPTFIIPIKKSKFSKYGKKKYCAVIYSNSLLNTWGHISMSLLWRARARAAGRVIGCRCSEATCQCWRQTEMVKGKDVRECVLDCESSNHKVTCLNSEETIYLNTFFSHCAANKSGILCIVLL